MRSFDGHKTLISAKVLQLTQMRLIMVLVSRQDQEALFTRVGLNRVKFQSNQDVYMSPKNTPVKWPAILEISISTHFARVLLAQRTLW